jgi:hypothetical protein
MQDDSEMKKAGRKHAEAKEREATGYTGEANRDLSFDQSQLCQSGKGMGSGSGSASRGSSGSATSGSGIACSSGGVSARAEEAGDPVDEDAADAEDVGCKKNGNKKPRAMYG